MILLSGGTSAFFILYCFYSVFFPQENEEAVADVYHKVSLKFSGCFLYFKKLTIFFLLFFLQH